MKEGLTLVSESGNFELGFFTPGNSDKRYLGIWYKKIPVQTVVWVANRDAPLVSSSVSSLRLTDLSVLELVNGTGGVVWATNSSGSVRNPVAKLLDSGNLVIKDEDDNDDFTPAVFLWQSFDHPCDIQLPGMKLGKDINTGLDRYLTSWTSSGDPSPGSYTYRLDYRGYPQPVLMKGRVEQYRNGPWNGVGFSGNPNLKPNPIFAFDFVMNATEIYYTYELLNKSVLSHRLLNPYGTMQRLVWSDYAQGWVMYLTAQSDNCDTYALCGKFGSCNIANSPQCSCLKGFEPKSPTDWDVEDWSDGCVRKTALGCNKRDGFIKYTNVKLPDTQYSWYNTKKGKTRTWVLVCSVILGTSLLVGSIILYWKRRFRRKGEVRGTYNSDELELPLFDISVIAQATNNFSDSNKLGEGGFGPVYKGKLEDGQEVAVKRLSKESRQGLEEFKNEVICIAKLQHRNLVKLLGCCIGEEESMLVYEYMSNKSLDFFIFDDMRSESLGWDVRYQIIKGIARGILYLHQDSRLRIVHRDLKASNILLDAEMNPKISDFGMARSFDGNDCEAKTSRVVGTYGYMSPEYAIDGIFSLKSDVFSFGVLVLEIVTGERNRGFTHPGHWHNLLGHAWMHFKEGRSLELVDITTRSSYNASQMLRAIHIALLCVQQSPDDRPGMPSVVVMLDSDGELPQPNEPGFFTGRDLREQYSVSSKSESYCSNFMSVTIVSGR
ncbi:hypothetical protein KSS87_012866 [Heliosperma pusillum]|nr:hypothetical protein KSS87_012866 [Heliosperma pusillum]